MIVEHGLISARFSECASVEAALAGPGVGWIGSIDPTQDELEQIALAFGLGDHALAQLAQRRRSRRVPRSRVTLLDEAAHLIFLGVELDGTDDVRMDGNLELLATRTGVAVLATDLPESLGPQALREVIMPLLGTSATAGTVLGLVISQVLDGYERLLDKLEDDAEAIADALFRNRDDEQLERIYALSRPVHAAAVGIQPLTRGFEELDRGDLDVGIVAALRSETLHLSTRLGRIDALLDATQQTYFNLAQDRANVLMERQSDVTRKMSAYALLIAIPTILFSLYGTNFEHVPLLGETWGYWVMLGLTFVLCGFTWWRLRVAEWI